MAPIRQKAIYWALVNPGLTTWLTREGVIIECPLNGQFHDTRDGILTSRNDVRGFAGDDDNDEPTLGTLKPVIPLNCHKTMF